MYVYVWSVHVGSSTTRIEKIETEYGKNLHWIIVCSLTSLYIHVARFESQNQSKPNNIQRPGFSVQFINCIKLKTFKHLMFWDSLDAFSIRACCDILGRPPDLFLPTASRKSHWTFWQASSKSHIFLNCESFGHFAVTLARLVVWIARILSWLLLYKYTLCM